MKTVAIKLSLISLMVVSVLGCGQKSHDHEGDHSMMHDTTQNSPNDVLYDEVMKVHDEVMPKMNDIYALKEELKTKASAAGLADEKKKEIDATISKLDSASESMMIWMRGFSPLPDSLGEEKAREYLETEMEKVKNVRTEIHEALEKGESVK